MNRNLRNSFIPLLVLIPSLSYAQTALNPGVVANSFSAATVTPSTGTAYALPAVATQITWQTSFGSAPASITVLLEASLDNSNWATIDTSTLTTGDVRTTYSSARFIRNRITTSSGGTAITSSIIAKAGPIATLPAVGNNSVSSNTFLAGDGSAAAPSFSFTNTPTMGFYKLSATRAAFTISSDPPIALDTNGLFLESSRSVSWSAGSVGSSGDLFLVRDAANTLALRNGTNGQLFNVYNTYTDASNYERVEIGVSPTIGANTFSVYVNKAGTGTVRPLALGGGSINFYTTSGNAWDMSTSGHFLAHIDNTYNIGAVGANRPARIYPGIAITWPGTTPTPTDGDCWTDTAAGNFTTAATTINYKCRNNGVTRTVASVTF